MKDDRPDGKTLLIQEVVTICNSKKNILGIYAIEAIKFGTPETKEKAREAFAAHDALQEAQIKICEAIHCYFPKEPGT